MRLEEWMNIEQAEVDIDRIRILPSFAACPPSDGKMAEKMEYYTQFGMPDGTITIDRDGWLLDGYIAYLILKQAGSKNIPCQILDRPWAAGRFRDDEPAMWDEIPVLNQHRVIDDPGPREFWYTIPMRLAVRLKPGDRVLLRSDYRFKILTAKSIEMCSLRRCPAAWGIKWPW